MAVRSAVRGRKYICNLRRGAGVITASNSPAHQPVGSSRGISAVFPPFYSSVKVFDHSHVKVCMHLYISTIRISVVKVSEKLGLDYP